MPIKLATTWRGLWFALKTAAPVAWHKWLGEQRVAILDKLAPYKCRLGYHHWVQAPARDKAADFDLEKDPVYMMCDRPGCRCIREHFELVETPTWLEIPDMMVLCKKSCKTCYGRGYSSMVKVSDPEQPDTTCKFPCLCLRIQPRYVHKSKPAAHDTKAPSIEEAKRA